MEDCDVLIVGGGPAGSTCAWRLREAGLHVIVIDKAVFPRDKPCAGWITPQVVHALQLDLAEYARGRTLQPITGFRISVMGRRSAVEVRYGGPVSFGIRRCEFDQYLLERSGATLRTNMPVKDVRRDQGRWIVNETMRAPILIGAGGHWCPVARVLNVSHRDQRGQGGGPIVAAQEAEFPIEASPWTNFITAADTPEFYFCPDLKGYGWCFRKQRYLNVGLGRIDPHGVSRATADFASSLKADGRLPPDVECDWRGHAYLVVQPRLRRTAGENVLLVGDAAGLAHARSGEGIRAGIESGLIAASMIARRERFAGYETRLRQQGIVGSSPGTSIVSANLSANLSAMLGGRLLQWPWFVQRVVLDRWFLRRKAPALGILRPDAA